LMAGNWKMHKTVEEARTFARALRAAVGAATDREVVVCPPFTAIFAVAQELAGGPIAWGGQNAHWQTHGAFTGEISALMLKDLGCRYVIIGHSERRQYFGETDETVRRRLQASIAAGVIPIACVGETLAQREAGQTFAVVERQVKTGLQGLAPDAGIVIAYEPVWAIGTGKTATPAQAQEVHA